MMFIRRPSGKQRSGAVPVHLNVYDLTPINGYAYWVGLGAYHSGVQGEIRARGGVRVRGARSHDDGDLRRRAAAVPRVCVPEVDTYRAHRSGAARAADAHGGDGRGVHWRHLQPDLQELQSLLQRGLPPPHREAHPPMGQPPSQDRIPVHLRVAHASGGRGAAGSRGEEVRRRQREAEAEEQPHQIPRRRRASSVFQRTSR